jgi:hypothetical protein
MAAMGSGGFFDGIKIQHAAFSLKRMPKSWLPFCARMSSLDPGPVVKLRQTRTDGYLWCYLNLRRPGLHQPREFRRTSTREQVYTSWRRMLFVERAGSSHLLTLTEQINHILVYLLVPLLVLDGDGDILALVGKQ